MTAIATAKSMCKLVRTQSAKERVLKILVTHIFTGIGVFSIDSLNEWMFSKHIKKHELSNACEMIVR